MRAKSRLWVILATAALAAAMPSSAAQPIDPVLPSALVPLRLHPIPQTVAETCRRAQAAARGTVLCPSVLPRPVVGWGGSPPPHIHAHVTRGAGRRVSGVDVGYGAPWEPPGQGWRQHLWRNRPCCFLHFEIYQRPAGRDAIPSSARPATLGGRKGLLKAAAGYRLGCPGDAHLYWCNHSAFLWTERGTRYVATLHLFGQRETVALLGRLVASLRPASRLPRTRARGLGVGVSPHSLTADGDDLWVTAVADRTPSFRGTIFRVDAGKAQVSARFHPGRAVGLAVGGDSLWAVTTKGVARLDRRSGERKALVSTGRWPRAAAVDKGTLWVINSAPFTPRRGSLVRVDTGTSSVVGAPVRLGRAPVALAASGGSIWVVDELEGVATRVAASARGVVSRTRVGRGPTSVAAGGGAIWVANTGERTVSRIDPRTNGVVQTIPVGLAPRGLVSVNGALWGVATGEGTVFRIDPNTNRAAVVARNLVDPLAVNVAADRLWVTTNSDGRLLELQLPA